MFIFCNILENYFLASIKKQTNNLFSVGGGGGQGTSAKGPMLPNVHEDEQKKFPLGGGYITQQSWLLGSSPTFEQCICDKPNIQVHCLTQMSM